MRYHFIFAICLLCTPIIGLAQSGDDSYVFYEGKTQEYDPKRANAYNGLSYQQTKGKVMFVWLSMNDGEPGNASQCETRIIWEIDKKLKEFEFKDQELEQVNAMYWQISRTADRGFQPINRGIIKGKRLKNGDWEIEIDVEVKGHLTGKNYRFNLNQTFLEP